MNPEIYMRRCIELALRGAGKVAPNPMVGALLEKDGMVIGEGWHTEFGTPHAEVNAITDAINKGYEKDISNSTLYVTLEPCSHHGKTPPCTDLIIRHSIPKVVIGCRDPFKEVNGKGIEKLKKAGVEVELGILEKETKELNKRFLTFHNLHRPYVILKWAQTSDGFIASAGTERLLISNDSTDRLVHKWRSEEAAIMVGTNTALQDDPSLTTRLWPGTSPARIIVDLDLRLPTSLKIYNGEIQTIIINSLRQGKEGNLSYYQVDKEKELVSQVLSALYQLNLLSLIVEGGAQLLGSFIDSGTWDEARVITGEKQIGKGLPAPVIARKPNSSLQLGTDKIEFFNNSSFLS